ncbi:MAG TPA: S1 RNA-binding domain-containing protein [Candidatus Dormibacteraeota bacterium]|jgi:small subunit ribosomal protein S1|nr:S1 RNA-binding domain-containing protein [Candidatus Dormibacteraeota bacterium]
MSDPVISNSSGANGQSVNASEESFKDILSQFERSKTRKPAEAGKGREGTVIAVTVDSVLVDIGFKTEGILPLSVFQSAGKSVAPGDKLAVSIKGRDPEGYYELSLGKIEQPKDWASLQKAFAEKTTIVGTVTGVVKGGLSVDVGVRAFLPASRSGTRDAAEMAKLVEQEIRCRITKLDEADEDVVVDRRVVAEEEELAEKDRRYSQVKEGETLHGTVRSLMDYGAFIAIGSVDALLHVSDISRSRVSKPADVLTVGQEVEVKVLKIDSERRRISVGMKQLEPDPWDTAAEKYKLGERARGTVTRVMDFGAFVELEPGVEGLIHVSEMSWGKKLKSASTIVKPGETVDVVILGVSIGERRISLGLKQALGDPWADAAQRFAAGSVVEGPVVSIMKFGAFVQLTEGVEGMIHVSEMSAEKHINHPQDVLRLGQVVKAQVLAVDTEKRQLRLSMKQLVPSGLDEYIVEHKEGDVVTGRVVDTSDGHASVELGEGIRAKCRLAGMAAESKLRNEPAPSSSKPDLSSLGSMLQARWKGNAPAGATKAELVSAGQIRKFRIAKIDPAAKKIELELA